MKVFWNVILSIIIIALVFCVTVLIWGGVTGQNFVEVIKSWFEIAPAVEDTLSLLI